ncbi:hypothetical protein MHYP_G00043210 [Metynnis hypsauchen]
MDRLKRKYILPGCDETEIPARTKRWKKRKALIETNNLEIHQSFQDLPSAHDSSEVWSPLSDLSQSLSGTAEEVDNLNHNSSDYDSDDASEDVCDVTHIAITDENSEDWIPLSGHQSVSGGEVSRIAGDLSEAGTSLGGQHCLSGEDVFNLMDYGDSDHDVENFSEDAHDAQHTTRLHDNCSDSTPRDRASPLFFEDESSTECDPHFNDLPNLSQSESSSNLNPDNLDDSVSMSVFEPRQSFTDSDSESILASGEQFSLAYEDSTDESVYEGEFSYEKFPQRTSWSGSANGKYVAGQ